jgi:Flp pilus assembly protein TadG
MLIEFAVAATALLLLTVGTVDAGRLMWNVISMQAALDNAVRCRSFDSTSNPTICPASTLSNYLSNYLTGTTQVTFSTPTGVNACPTALSNGAVVGLTGTVTYQASFVKSLTATYTRTICFSHQ